MTKNTLGDLNNHLFAQLERLNDEEITGDKLTEEMNRAKAISHVASQIIANGKLVLDAIRAAEDSLNENARVPKMLEGGKGGHQAELIEWNEKGGIKK